MNDIDLRAAYWFVALACVGCGTNDTTDFFSSARGGSESGGGGAQPGGTGGTELGGAGGTQPGGSGGAQPGGAGGTAQGGAGIAGSVGAGSGGTSGGAGGSSGDGGASGSGGASGGGKGGTGGKGTSSFSCGSLMCVEGRQYCIRTLPAVSGGSELRMCQPFPDSCNTLDCSCFCAAPQMSPCGPASACMCSGDPGHINVVCGGD